jgi:hypothetical protein
MLLAGDNRVAGRDVERALWRTLRTEECSTTFGGVAEPTLLDVKWRMMPVGGWEFGDGVRW